MFEPVFTKQFLEKQLNQEICSFSVRPGSCEGDNFMGAIYALKIKLNPISYFHKKPLLEDEYDEYLHLVAKCYPKHPAGHEYLNRCSIFYKELSIYTILMRKFEMHLLDQNLVLKLPLAPIVGGKATDFSKQNGTPEPSLMQNSVDFFQKPTATVDENGNISNPFFYGPLDNFLLLTDVRRTLGFQMTNAHNSLSYGHCSLLVQALAKIHAISWAYQKKNSIDRLCLEFPFLQQKFVNYEQSENPLHSLFESVLETLVYSSGSHSPLVSGTKKFQKVSGEILRWFQTDGLNVNGVRETDLNKFMRLRPPEEPDDYVPWRVFIHGDCWSNNMLFRYDSQTGLPTEVILVDFQASHDACPTLDLAYMMYICTDQQFRKAYSSKLLQEYHDNFKQFCNLLNVELLPGFCIESLQRRFHRSKLYAYCLSVVVLPNILKQHNNNNNKLDNTNESREQGLINPSEMPSSELGLINSCIKNKLFHKRITEIAEDLCKDGII